jgi:TonB family protein
MKTQLLIALLFIISVSVIGQNDTEKQHDKIEEVKIITIVESMPEFIGGFEALKKYIATHAIYTERARKEKVQGKVYVNFTVDKSGAIHDPKVLKGIHPDLDSVSLSLVSNMPNWNPAKQRGKPVSCQYNLAISFNFDQVYDNPEPSKYWKKKGRKKFMKRCLSEFGKSETDCSCWYNYIIWNYNHLTMKEIDLLEMFNSQQPCEGKSNIEINR